MPAVIPPTIDRGNDWFWAGVADRKLLLERCAGCGLLRRPGVPMCGSCHSVLVETQAATGRGTIHSWIVSKHPTEPDADDRIVVLVELEEGIRLVSNLVGSPLDEVENDLPVELCWETYGAVTLPQFRLVR
ncbi:MAG: hypothetical protein JWO68_2306 [Actinomycetia bacterium]|nr:hypothetical protein [Actinomycetes bacterium]